MKLPMKPPADLTPDQLSRWRMWLARELENHQDALEWLDLWLRASNTLDDLVDQDVQMERAAPCRLAEEMIALLTHPFYRQHEAALGPAMLTGLAAYRASIVGSADDKDTSLGTWYLAELGTFVQFLVLMLAAGYTRTASAAFRLRELMQERQAAEETKEARDG
jgi:hypothetical protein